MSEEFTGFPPSEESPPVIEPAPIPEVAVTAEAPSPPVVDDGIDHAWADLEKCPNGHGLESIHRSENLVKPSRILWAYHCRECGARWLAEEV